MREIDYSGYEHILVERRGEVLTVTMNRPDQLNAIDHALHEELGQIFTDVARDDRTSVAILTGAGRAFSAGGDIKAMMRHADETGKPGHYIDMSTAKRIIYSMLDLEKPLIAKVNGVAIGLGATLALMCDLTYMADHAKIGDPHVTAGVVAGDGSAIIWPQLIGFARAKEYLMTGEALDARTAEAIGLVNHAVKAEALDAVVNKMADRLAQGPREAIRWTKVSVNVALRQLAHSMLDTSLAYEMLTMRSPSHAEAICAFTEGRKPDFARR
jgi:enoyl-CoA hydratase